MTDYKPVIDITEVQGHTFPRFRIGNQYFLVGTAGSNEEADYFCQMLKKAFENYEKYVIEKHLDEIVKRVNEFESDKFRKFPDWMIPKDRVVKIIKEAENGK